MALLVARALKESALVVHPHEVSILIPIHDEILLIAGRGCNVLTILLVDLGANSEILIRCVERVRTARVIAQLYIFHLLLWRHNVCRCSTRCLRYIPDDLPVSLQLVLVIFLDL